MATFENSAEDRTESPSQYRREEFRRQGTVALSREILSIAVLMAGGLCLYGASRFMYDKFAVLAEYCFKFATMKDLSKQELLDLRPLIFRSGIEMALPLFIATTFAGLLAAIAQVGVYFTSEPLTPKWERLDPIAGFMRIFSSNGLVEASKAILKMAIAAVVVWAYLKSHTELAGNLYGRTVPELNALTFQGILGLFLWLMAALTILAVLDLFFQRFQLEKQLKMTRREAKEEFKLREGDPLIKSRIKSIQRRIAGRRMMEEVPQADVVVTNPTHLSVALKYDVKTMSAPKVVAKGAGVIAMKIRETARKHGVPLVENKPLARTLFKQIDVGESIPRELFKAVAEVLAYVYRLRRAAQASYSYA